MTKKITLVEIEPGCITCGACEFVAPEVFEVTDLCRVQKKVDFQKYEEQIKEAALLCPVSVIFFRQEETT